MESVLLKIYKVQKKKKKMQAEVAEHLYFIVFYTVNFFKSNNINKRR